ncbi:Serine/threonine-protein kinase PknE [Nonomuraea coxensis DSM 45129]|uniref:Serine/threonine-protein kinase PknE n=1 Tax=Nonomuraea coxensis DSM 45129 TaxID=1122611 RepID=A0ABX8TZX2_9ACTN|nr:thioredoxin domain-containing protein [Nonomuraea coxensis]QYC40751.1 Serine/threonine-protein kinase PknE [Nonomuraea coxensis DSM 45129]
MGKGERTTATRSAREKIKEQQAAARARDRRKRAITYTAAGVTAVAAVGAGIWYGAGKYQSEEATAGLAPITVQPDGTVVMAQSGVEKPVLDVYEDFQCPACKEAERVSGQTIRNLAAEGKAKVVYHAITIFSQEPTRSNSLRAGNAARCVADGKQWMAFHDLLFENQPPENKEGFTNGQLIEWGKEAGVSAPGFEQCVNSGKNVQAQQSYSQKIMDEQKLTHTPTLKLNGKEVDNAVVFSPSELRDAVTKAAK